MYNKIKTVSAILIFLLILFSISLAIEIRYGIGSLLNNSNASKSQASKLNSETNSATVEKLDNIGNFVIVKNNNLLSDYGIESFDFPCGNSKGELKIVGNVGEILSISKSKKCEKDTKDYYEIKWDNGSRGFSESTNLEFFKVKPQIQIGYINGKVGYSDNNIPEHRVCAKTIKSNVIYCTKNRKLSTDESLKNPIYSLEVPIGNYYVYMEITDPTDPTDLKNNKAYFTSCYFEGAKLNPVQKEAQCLNKTEAVNAVSVNVAPKEVVQNIDTLDWNNQNVVLR